MNEPPHPADARPALAPQLTHQEPTSTLSNIVRLSVALPLLLFGVPAQGLGMSMLLVDYVDEAREYPVRQPSDDPKEKEAAARASGQRRMEAKEFRPYIWKGTAVALLSNLAAYGLFPSAWRRKLLLTLALSITPIFLFFGILFFFF